MAEAPSLIPYVPATITVHLGPPNSNAQNVTVPFPDYIKNVASSELYPTWPESALTANIYAIISYALNRVYTEFYRSQGYDFDITNSTAIDQSYVYGRSTFDSVNKIVDRIFNDYLKRPAVLEPLAAKFCNGTTVTCEGLSQWGSVDLANQGYFPYDILANYYGKNLTIVRNAPIRDIRESYPGAPLRKGDKGFNVARIQNYLNVISNNYPAIPKIYPVNGEFDENTEAAVRKFQEIFELTVDGIVGRDTWYKLSYLYTGIKRLSELDSEGVYLSGRPLEFPAQTTPPVQPAAIKVMQIDPSSPEQSIEVLQYFLSFLSGYYPTIPPVTINGIFDAQTKDAVMAVQKQFELPVTGIVDAETWSYIYNSYVTFSRDLLARVNLSGAIKVAPFPGNNLSLGSTGDDVRTIQYYLNIIATADPDIRAVTLTGVYGPRTRDDIIVYQKKKGLPQTGVVDKATWDSIASTAYDIASSVSPTLTQYPGYPLVRGMTDEQLKQQNKTMGTPILNLEVMLHEITFGYNELPGILPDGIFGGQTLALVTAYQKLMGLPQTGVVDRQTWDSIVNTYKEVIKITRPPKDIQVFNTAQAPSISPASDDFVYFLEIMFNTISKKYVNCLPIDSSNNPQYNFEQNIKEMQKILGLPETGILDNQTWNGIVSIYESSK